jgi:hypothetical protein
MSESEIQPKHRRQIERWLRRQLTEDELRPVESLEALANDQLEVVAELRPQNLIAPVLYLNFVDPSATMADLTPFIDNIADIVAARKAPRDWPNLALFERYAGRALSAAEKRSAATLQDLSPEQIALATTLACQEQAVAFLYLGRVVPGVDVDACNALVSELATSA